MPPRVHASASRSISSARAGCGSNGPERRVALDVPLHDAGLEDLPRRERRAADDARDVPRRRPPRCRRRSAPSRPRRPRTRAPSQRSRPSVCIAFVATIPKSHGGSAAASVVALRAPDDVARARQPEAVRVDRVDVRLRDVVGPDLDVVELREVRREERAHRPAADDADPHFASAGRNRASDGSENSRPPVSPLGRTISTSAMTALTTTIRDPDGRSIVRPSRRHPVLHLREHRVERADEQRADDRAPEARRAADDEHRERDERQVEVDGVDVDRDEVDVEAAGEPGEEAGERERREALPVDRDSDGARRGRILARRAKLPPEPAPLVRERGHDRRARRRPSPAGGRSSPAPTRTCSARARSSRSSGGCCS